MNGECVRCSSAHPKSMFQHSKDPSEKNSRQETNAAVLNVVVKDTMKARDKDGVLASKMPGWIFMDFPVLPG